MDLPDTLPPRPRRTKVNQDPYGGDGLLCDDTDIFVEQFSAMGLQDAIEQCVNAGVICENGHNGADIAAQRLELLKGHLECESFQLNDSTDSSSGSRVASVKFSMDDKQYHHSRDGSQERTIESDRAFSPINLQPLILGQSSSTPMEKSRLPQESAPLPPLNFHCPYHACHLYLHNLIKVLCETAQYRPCVHTGCSFISTTKAEWLIHISTAHHDILPRAVLVPEQVRERENKAAL